MASDGSGFFPSRPKMNFVEKMVEIVDRQDTNHLIHWGPRGDTFIVEAPAAFETLVLKNYMKSSSANSWTRSLNFWGFRKLTKSRNMQQAWEFSHPRFTQGKPIEYYTANIRRRTAADFTPSHMELDGYRTEILSLRDQLARQERVLAMKDNELALARRTIEHQAVELRKTRSAMAAIRGNFTTAPPTSMPALTSGGGVLTPPHHTPHHSMPAAMHPAQPPSAPPSAALNASVGAGDIRKRRRTGEVVEGGGHRPALRGGPAPTWVSPAPGPALAQSFAAFRPGAAVARAPSVVDSLADDVSLGGASARRGAGGVFSLAQPSQGVLAAAEAATGLGLLASAGSIAESASVTGSAIQGGTGLEYATSEPGIHPAGSTGFGTGLGTGTVPVPTRGNTPVQVAGSTASWAVQDEGESDMWAVLDESLRQGVDEGNWVDEFTAAGERRVFGSSPMGGGRGAPKPGAPTQPPVEVPGPTTPAVLAGLLTAFTPAVALSGSRGGKEEEGMLCTGEDVCTSPTSVLKLQAYLLSLPPAQCRGVVTQLLARTAAGAAPGSINVAAPTPGVTGEEAAGALRRVLDDGVARRFVTCGAGTPAARGGESQGKVDPRALQRMAAVFPPRFILACVLPLPTVQGLVLASTGPVSVSATAGALAYSTSTAF